LAFATYIATFSSNLLIDFLFNMFKK